jgi:recombinational DNA repair ATPase RecF
MLDPTDLSYVEYHESINIINRTREAYVATHLKLKNAEEQVAELAIELETRRAEGVNAISALFSLLHEYLLLPEQEEPTP